MTSRHPADQREREAALDIRRSFIVQAPAGSGKTELLVQRYLRLLDIVEKPEEIVAITFTKKAAAEMRSRVMQKLSPEIAPRLRIQTIDALCSSLTRQMPVLARFGAQPAVAEDATGLYREAAVRTLAELSPPVTRLLAHLDNNVAVAADLLAGMLERRDQWLRQTGEAPARAELEAVLASERERLLRNARALHAAASVELADELLTQKYEWRKRPAAPPELVAIPGLLEALVALRGAPPASYSDTQWQALEAILALLNPAVAQLIALFGERGEVDFTQIAHGALQALGTPEEPTDLLLSMDARVRHLLVDEFQDTSNSQWELLMRLTAGWEAGDGRTVFVVGDPMQSIYRFRDAQVGLFLQARREGLPGVQLEPLRLATNFRSQAGVVDWVNRVFPLVLPATEDEMSGAVPYSPSVSFHPASEHGEPAVETFADREEEACRVVELVQAAQGKTAILVRNRTHLDAIVPALKQAGIRFRAVEIEQLGERQVVQDLFALTRALTHAADRVAWLALLRAPWCGLALEEFSEFFEARRQVTIWESMQEHARLQSICDVLRPALDDRLRGTLRDRVEGTWLALGGPACVEEPTELEDAQIFLDELERLEEGGELESFSSLADSLSRLYALPDVDAGDGAVEIMTIHKAKGLEFDTVIVPGLDRRPRGGSRPLFAWRGLPGKRLLLAPIDETGGEEEVLYKYVRSLDAEAEDIEAGRLLYVAATRAKSRLHLLACVKAGEDGSVALPNRRCLLGLAWPALSRHVGAPPATASQMARRAKRSESLRRLAPGFELPAPPRAVSWESADASREVGGEIEFSWAGESARHIGSVVHRWLQRFADDALRGWDRERVESLRRAFADELGMRGIPESEMQEATERVVSALSNALSDPRGRWLLGPQREARNEYRVTAIIDGERRSLVIDRTFVDESGVRRIVDYKTSSHEGADIDEFLDQERERYRLQLERYATAMGSGSTALGLYFPLLSGWREWKPK
ncbi:MAG TPA: UvrD-helicase domain-containing protein [Burkholderiales bacterium]|nr:UvrD-helicase domain-containing protein [Burkholderiales bacterium]